MPKKSCRHPPGERYELCRSVHAEANAIIQASANEMKGATLYLCSLSMDDGSIYGRRPCKMCTRIIINAGIKNVITREKDGSIKTYNVEDWIRDDDPDITKNTGEY